MGEVPERVVLRAGNEFGWIPVQEYVTLRQRELNEERKRMIWIIKKEEKQKRPNKGV